MAGWDNPNISGIEICSSYHQLRCLNVYCIGALGNSKIWDNSVTRVTFCHERPLNKLFESKGKAQWSLWKVSHWGEEALGHWSFSGVWELKNYLLLDCRDSFSSRFYLGSHFPTGAWSVPMKSWRQIMGIYIPSVDACI